MIQSKRDVNFLLMIVVALFTWGSFVPTAAAKEVDLDATYTLQANGDLGVVMKLTTSMDLYQKMRQSISNLYLLLRNLSSQRAELEVSEKKADWDDSARTITLSYTALGVARNLGNHWEFDISPQAEFSNLDEDQRTVYFSEEVVTPLGKIAGRGKLILPKEAGQYRWDANKRVVSYIMPEPQSSSRGISGLRLLAGLLLVLGGVAFIASFIGKKGSPPVEQLPPPQKLINE